MREPCPHCPKGTLYIYIDDEYEELSTKCGVTF